MIKWTVTMVYELIIGILFLTTIAQCTRPGIANEYCDTETFEPKCEDGQVILMTSARYGRMKLARCVTIDLGYLGCHTDVLNIADRHCSGRQTCLIRVPDPDMESTRPCLKELKTYLEATYICLPISSKGNSCLETGTNLTANQGWIPSSITMETVCGSEDLPWMITVDPGQRINVTLLDFSVERTYHVKRLNDINGFDIEATVCNEYAVIHEVESEWKTMVCGGNTRWKEVYLSKTNTLRIEITNTGNKYFIIKYEAVGCPDMTAPDYGWFKRTEDGASVGCTHTDEEWQLRCSGSSWVGHMGNCSATAHTGFMDNQHGYGISLPLGASIAIIIGAALGVGLVVVIIGLIRFRRNRNYETPTREAISLQEKSPVPPDVQQTDLQQQPLPPIPPPDSGHCSMDTENTAAGIPSTPSSSYPVMTHSLQRTVRINGNEYAHIWETPLPDPKGRKHSKQQPPGPLHPTCRLEITKDPSGKNTFYTCTRYTPPLSHGVQGSPQFDGYHHHLCPEANRSLSRASPSTSASHTPRGGTSTFCSPNATPTRTAVGGVYGPSPQRPAQPMATTAANFCSGAAGPSGGVTCGVVRHVPADFSEGGPRYSTLERKPGYGNNNSSSSSV